MSGLTRWGFDRKAGGPKRPVPLVRAYRGPWPIRSHRTMAEVMRDEAEQLQPVPPKPKKEAKPRIKSGATVKGYQAKAGDEAQGGRICEPCMEPVSRPAAGRSVAATSEFMDVTAGETAPVPNPAEATPPKQASAPVAVMAALPLAVSTRPAPARAPIEPQQAENHHPRAGVREYFPDTSKAREIRPSAAPIDWGRVANAVASRRVAAPAPKPKPRFPALSKEPCRRCGVPGSRGCDHQLPYEEFA